METGQQWLSLVDLARELNVPVQTVRNWRAKGTGPRGHRLGRHVRFRRSDIELWLSQHADEEPAA